MFKLLWLLFLLLQINVKFVNVYHVTMTIVLRYYDC